MSQGRDISRRPLHEIDIMENDKAEPPRTNE